MAGSRGFAALAAVAAVVVAVLIGSGEARAIVSGFTTEEDLRKLFQLSEAEMPEVYLDMNVETTADFLNLSRREATLASFLGTDPTAAAGNDITTETVVSCDPEYSVFGTLERGGGNLGAYDFDLTVSALEGTGISALLEAKPEAGDFKAYVLVAPTDSAWVKLKQQLEASPSSESEALPLQSLLTYQIYGETNQTLFNAVKDVVNGTFFADAPFSFFLNVPIDMLDGNATVLSTGSTSGVPPELNGSPILALEPACNGVILAVDDVLLPGAAVKQYMGRPEDMAPAHGGCSDVVPPSPLGTEWTCQDQKYWGKCQEYWMWAGDYCKQTCGYCGLDEFPYAYGGAAAASRSREGDGQEEEEAPTRYVDPCACSPDGVSGGVYTGVAGCDTMTASQLMGMAYASSVSDSSAAINVGRQFGSRFDGILPGGTPEFNYCYVVQPGECSQVYTEPSPFFEGVRWRFC
ncbi:hypothetical protein HOP50_05g37660 [Chloropicon primus]|uniref:FAS1 domain-containing protein n=1 Tax=Chloropicon primus TaxID=1764295 RepID=A0A5B8MKT3_9CHLO|nr:hypothetical protein A3770_05p37560 [Chloropicon primus]UPR00452.1 hypothetical protein HOP50_05g37660 [Chloropicon primus]|mmetsp:Transcript_11526/g.31981  ORF Transcript_11526/g.31981 Transcript_11526/m.31981 type:complete len:463 (-) Transcript_11526:114-1502(-)|eukprot:QDZ21238.1 hypothetical protein A3770_05p37560 [Chloropicon primus]